MSSVTVIIPTFNRCQLLLETLSSVFAQTFGNYEVIVVDDGSTDGTRQALAAFPKKIRYIWQPHGGQASARNRGLSEARSVYAAFLDSDDLWEPNFLEVATGFLANHPELAMVCTARAVFASPPHQHWIREPLLHGDLFRLLFWRNFVQTSAVLVDLERLQRVGIFDESLDQAEDYDLWLRIARKFPIAFINQPLCHWRRHAGNVSRNKLRQKLCTLRVVESNYDPDRICQRLYRLRRSRLQVSLGRAFLQAGEVPNATACFRKAIAYTPWRIRPWSLLAAATIRRARHYAGC